MILFAKPPPLHIINIMQVALRHSPARFLKGFEGGEVCSVMT
jgi:hypothetical protein